jgi:heme exporter protein D
MTKHVVGMVGAVLGFLGGLWLILAPFAQGYQPSGASWADATVNDFWVGIGLALVSLIGFATYALSLREEMIARGILERRERKEEAAPEPQQEQPSYAGNTSIEQAIVPLLNEMLKDMQRQRQQEEHGGRSNNDTPYQQEQYGRSSDNA